MFNCTYCKRTSKNYEKAFRAVTKERTRLYPDGSYGSEIVEEKLCCQVCYPTVPEAVRLDGVVGEIDPNLVRHEEDEDDYDPRDRNNYSY